MTKPYFRQVPNFEYVSRNPGDKYISEYIPVKNLFKRGKLREDIFGNLQFFEKYSIIGDERPDNVAYKFYNDETLDWVVLLSNNILNIQSEWPMTQVTLDKVMLDRYGSYDNLYNGVHHYETEEIKNSLGITVLKGGIRISPTWKTNGNFLEINNSKIEKIYSGNFITTLSGNITEDDTIITLTDASEILDLPQPIVIGDEEIRVISKDNNTLTVERGKNNTIAVSHSNNESVDLIKATTTVTVKLVNGIPGLRVGSQININNVPENQYNGQYYIKEIITRGESNVKKFTYELSEVPNVASPILANPRKEEALFTLSGNESIFIIALEEQTKFDFNYEVGDIEVYKNGSKLSESSFTANNGTSITLSTPCAEGDTIEVKSPQQLILANSYYYEYWDAGLGYSTLVPSSSFIKPITNYGYELKIEDEKRNIYVLKPRYLNVIFNDMDDIMPYKKGSQQYVSETLKRGDNIRLYE
jgi:hypothetical protein